MASSSAEAEAKCPVDHKTRERWLEAAKAKGQPTPPHPSIPHAPTQTPPPSLPPSARYSLDSGSWTSQALPSISPASQPKRPKILNLDTHREISTIPRSLPTPTDRSPNAAERAALPPSNAEADTGHDAATGNWIYPSQEMFFNAMKRKGHSAEPSDMSSVVPIHNAVNERAWAEIKAWEAGQPGSEECGGGPKLVSFAGDSKALTPRARWNNWVYGWKEPFDRHDWVVDRCGRRVEYVIDFYSGKGGGLSFFLDVRPKLNSWEGARMRIARTFGM